jgi:methylenetetrahydrofolate reductase (NADPH)
MFGRGKPVFSIEVFPPKKDAARDFTREGVFPVLEQIAALKPDFISVTCSAGGSGGDGTLEIASFIKNKCGVEAMAHLTCASLSRDGAERAVRELGENNIENILALRGDVNPDTPARDDFKHASDLARFIVGVGGDFCVSGACYPEGHAQADSLASDLKNLKKKVDAGVSCLFTQLFFDNALFYSFMEKVRLIGIDAPVSAGIMPVTSKKQIERTVSMCAASLPPKFAKMVARYENDAQALRDAGMAYAEEQIADLISNGVDGIHLYAMNSPYAAERIAKIMR